MKNNKIAEAFEKCGPDDETKKIMLEWVLSQKRQTRHPAKADRLRGFKRWGAVCAAAAMILSVSVVGYAAYRWMTGEQIALKLDNRKLAEAFGQTDEEIQIKTVDGYEIAYIGSVSGRGISDEIVSEEELDAGRTYAAVAVAKTNGEAMEEQDMIVVTPFIQGLEPWKYNIYTLGNGSARRMVSDGILYWLMETSNIEIFSDRALYIGVMDADSDFQAFLYEPETGLITENPDYKGFHALFTMDTQQMKADPAAAEAYLSSLHSQWEKELYENIIPDNAGSEIRNLKYQDTVYTDERNGLKITFPFYNTFKGSFYGWYCQVEGSGIDRITFSLDGGTFYHKTEYGEQEAYSLGEQEKYVANVEKECMLKPEEHENTSCVYPGSQEKPRWLYEKAGSSYTVDYTQQESAEFRYAIRPDGNDQSDEDPAAALENTSLLITIEYQDGTTVQKQAGFQAVKDTDDKRFINFCRIIIKD